MRLLRLARIAVLTLMPLMIATAVVYRDAFRTPTTITAHTAVAVVRLALPNKGVGYLVGNPRFEAPNATTPLEFSDRETTYDLPTPSQNFECFVVQPFPLRWPCRPRPYWVVPVTWPGDCSAFVQVDGYSGNIMSAGSCTDISLSLNVQVPRPSLGQSGWSCDALFACGYRAESP